MSHVDDGTLHAYLDGALDEYPAAEAERVREHLDVCGACRSRLDAERAIRDQAASILSVAVPHVDVPTLEELRSHVRAGAPARRSVPSYLNRIGWAASIALALGTGWLLRGGPVERVDRPAGAGAPSEEVATADDRALANGATGLEEAGIESDPGSAREAPRTRLRDDELLPSRTQPPAIRVEVTSEPVVLRSGVSEPADVVAELEASPPPLPPAPRLEDTVGPRIMTPELLVDGADSGRGRDATAERRVASDGIVTSANVTAPPSTVGPGPTLQVGDLSDSPRDVVENEESYSLVVPGLEVLDVRFRGAGVRPEGQVALQRLESGDTLRVIHLPKEMELSSLEAAVETDRQIVVQTASGWIVMRAPVSEEALLDLMRRLLSAN